MCRVVPLAILLLVAAAPSTRAEDRLIDGRPCNGFCRAWLGLASGQFMPQGTPDEAASPAGKASFEAAPVRRHRRYAAWQPRDAYRKASRTTRVGGDDQRLVPEPPRPERSDLARTDGHGGYPSGIPPEMASAVAQALPPAAHAPAAPVATWEQTALRIFEGANDPPLVPLLAPANRRVRPRRH